MASRTLEMGAAERAGEASSVVWAPVADAGASARRELAARSAARRRGLIGLAGGLAVAALFDYLKPHRPQPAYVVAAVAVLFAAIAVASPTGLYPRLQRALDAFGRGVGAVVTWVLMTILFFVFVLPVGAILRAAGKLAITKGFDPRSASYWSEPSQPDGAGAYRKQF